MCTNTDSFMNVVSELFCSNQTEVLNSNYLRGLITLPHPALGRCGGGAEVGGVGQLCFGADAPEMVSNNISPPPLMCSCRPTRLLLHLKESDAIRLNPAKATDAKEEERSTSCQKYRLCGPFSFPALHWKNYFLSHYLQPAINRWSLRGDHQTLSCSMPAQEPLECVLSPLR